MATIGGADFTNFRNVRVRGDVGDSSSKPGAIRLVATSALESTLSVNTTYQDSNYSWTLPAKSGPIGICGTFTVNMPSISALSTQGTNVVVAGIRAEDGLIATIRNMGTTLVAQDFGAVGFPFLSAATPTNTGINLTFVNPTTTASMLTNFVVSYTAWR